MKITIGSKVYYYTPYTVNYHIGYVKEISNNELGVSYYIYKDDQKSGRWYSANYVSLCGSTNPFIQKIIEERKKRIAKLEQKISVHQKALNKLLLRK